MRASRIRSAVLAVPAVVVLGLMGGSIAVAGNYSDAVMALEPDHYYRLDEAELGPARLDPDGFPLPVAGDASGTQYDSPVADSGFSGDPIEGFHEGFFAPDAVEPFAEVGVCGPPFPGFSGANRAFLANNAGSINLGPGEFFADPVMTVAMWFRVPCGGDACTGPPASDGGDRLFTNNSASGSDHFQITFGWGANLVVGVDTCCNSLDAARQVPHGTLNVKDGKWHHVVASRNGPGMDNVIVVVDGVDYTADMVDSTDSWGRTGSNAHIASRPGGDGGGNRQNANGEVDEVAIWLGRQLTVEEAQMLYESALEEFDPGPVGGRQLPGDCNQDGMLNISDGICLLGHLFLGDPISLPCGEQTQAAGNLALLDGDGGGVIDLSDAVGIFSFLFLGADAPAYCVDESCAGCVTIPGCPTVCAE